MARAIKSFSIDPKLAQELDARIPDNQSSFVEELIRKKLSEIAPIGPASRVVEEKIQAFEKQSAETRQKLQSEFMFAKAKDRQELISQCVEKFRNNKIEKGRMSLTQRENEFLNQKAILYGGSSKELLETIVEKIQEFRTK